MTDVPHSQKALETANKEIFRLNELLLIKVSFSRYESMYCTFGTSHKPYLVQLLYLPLSF